MPQYQLLVRTATPLFIGKGEELRKGIDFSMKKRADGSPYTLRFNTDAILKERYQPENPALLPEKLLTESDFSSPQSAHFFRYRLSGEPRSKKTDSRLQAAVKDVYDVPYIPGSSLKGAVRTALARHLIRTGALSFAEHVEIHPDAKKADDRLEKALFGADSYTDWMRALQISDARLIAEQPRPGQALEIANINPLTRKGSGNPSAPIEAEVIRKSTDFQASLKVDDWLLTQPGFSGHRKMLQNLPQILQQEGFLQLQAQKNWFAEVPGSEDIVKMIDKMLAREEAYKDKSLAFVLLGSGSGWDGITYGGMMQQQNPGWFEELIRLYKLQPAQRRGASSAGRKAGDIFPASHKVIMDRQTQRPAQLLGWCYFHFTEVTA